MTLHTVARDKLATKKRRFHYVVKTRISVGTAVFDNCVAGNNPEMEYRTQPSVRPVARHMRPTGRFPHSKRLTAGRGET